MRNRQATQLLCEQSRPGCCAVRLPECDVPPSPVDELLPPEALARSAPPLPELTEPDLVRHFVNLSTQNMSVDAHFYPLGSCTMKYNPKRNERLAGLSGLIDLVRTGHFAGAENIVFLHTGGAVALFAYADEFGA